MIIINFYTAEEIATQMNNASKLIENAGSKSFVIDERTSLAVNSKAQEANKQMIELVKQFNEAFQITIKNIQLATEEFRQKDQEIKEKIDRSIEIRHML